MRTLKHVAAATLFVVANIGCAVNRYIAPATLTVDVIDSLVKSIDENKQFEQITRTGTVGSAGKFKAYFLQDNSSNQLYRVRYVESLDTAENIAWYYDHGKVVFADFILVDQHLSERKIIYSCFYYFRNDSLLAAIDEDTTQSNANNVLKHGKAFYRGVSTKPPKRKSQRE